MERRSKILLADGDPNRLRLVQKLLSSSGYEVLLAGQGEEGLRRTVELCPELAILGARPAVGSGFEVCRQLRNRHSALVIVLLDCDDEERIVQALEAGADEAVVNPLREREFLARVRALLRCRAQQVAATEGVFKVGDLSVDLKRRQVYKNGVELALTRTEFSLLAYLLRKRDSVVTTNNLLENVWGGAQERSSPETIRVHIGKLRKKIEPPEYISNERGRGYRFWSRSD